MANKKRFWLGILAMVLVLGMTVVGCDNGSTGNGGNSILDTMGLSTANPNSTALNIGNITLTQFNEVKELLGGYQGWSTFDGDLNIIWTGRTQTQANQAETALDGLSWIGGKSYGFMFNPTREEEDGLYLPAGTVWVYFY